jgi:hypothetical protein
MLVLLLPIRGASAQEPEPFKMTINGSERVSLSHLDALVQKIRKEQLESLRYKGMRSGPLSVRGAPIEEARRLTAPEQRAFDLARGFSERLEPLLDFSRLAPELSYDPKTKVWSVTLWTVPRGTAGQKAWRCSTVSFTVLVGSDESVREEGKGWRWCW